MELNELVVDKNQEMHWRETARWIKFEEDVEEDTARWGKPHVASLSFRSLLELRKTIAHGESGTIDQVPCVLLWDRFCWTASVAGDTGDTPTMSVSRLHVGSAETDHPAARLPGFTLAQGCLCWFLALHCCSQACGSCDTQLCLGLQVFDPSLV